MFRVFSLVLVAVFLVASVCEAGVFFRSRNVSVNVNRVQTQRVVQRQRVVNQAVVQKVVVPHVVQQQIVVPQRVVRVVEVPQLQVQHQLNVTTDHCGNVLGVQRVQQLQQNNVVKQRVILRQQFIGSH